MNKFNKLLLVMFATLFLMSACGQKGPLYLPDNETEQDSEENSEDST